MPSLFDLFAFLPLCLCLQLELAVHSTESKRNELELQLFEVTIFATFEQFLLSNRGLPSSDGIELRRLNAMKRTAL